MAATDTINATNMPSSKTMSSEPVKLRPNLYNLIKLAPAIIGTDKKKEYSAATERDTPNSIAPSMVAPEREVPGTKAKTCMIPIIKAYCQESWEKRSTLNRLPLL